jgi:hypothetical protein
MVWCQQTAVAVAMPGTPPHSAMPTEIQGRVIPPLVGAAETQAKPWWLAGSALAADQSFRPWTAALRSTTASSSASHESHARGITA